MPLPYLILALEANIYEVIATGHGLELALSLTDGADADVYEGLKRKLRAL